MSKHWIGIGIAVLVWAGSMTASWGALSIQSAITLGRMHSDMMEAIEEGMAYLVMKEACEKKDFNNKIATFDELSRKFVHEADAPYLKKDFDKIIQKKEALVQAFRTAFSRIEGGQADMDKTLHTLEEAIDCFTEAFGPFTKHYFELTAAGLPDNSHEKALFTLFAMHHDILECIEESFGYLLLGDDEEAKDFFDTLEDFRGKAQKFSAEEYLSKPINASKRSLFDDMMSRADNVENAARKMFINYKSRGAIPMDDVAAYEKAVDALTEAYEKLLDQVMQEL